MARSWKTEAVVLRSIRFGEADRVLHLYTLERGRVGAIAKGARKTRSRFGARLEPFSHVELMLHEGRGELQTVTGADLLRPHDGLRTDAYRMAVGHIGLEAVLRLFLEGDENARAFHALTRFLDLLDDVEGVLPAQPALDPLVRLVRSRDRARRLLAGGGRGRLRGVRGRVASRFRRGARRGPGAARASARRRARRRTARAGSARLGARDRVLVRVPRRLPAADARAEGVSTISCS
ncbi:MAG: DNA repair protein RecO [Actinobacteria bacterium]|nr:MAG: DNA repair protein RecO [Actinomycetota bacterium]